MYKTCANPCFEITSVLLPKKQSTSIQWLESPKSLTQTVGKGQTHPGGNLEKPNLNSKKGTDDPKPGKQTDASMWKISQLR